MYFLITYYGFQQLLIEEKHSEQSNNTIKLYHVMSHDMHLLRFYHAFFVKSG